MPLENAATADGAGALPIDAWTCSLPAIKIQGPDGDIIGIIRSVRKHAGKLSDKPLKEFTALADDALAGEVLAAIEAALPLPGKSCRHVPRQSRDR